MSAAETRATASLAEAIDAAGGSLPCHAEPELWYSPIPDDRREAAEACGTCPIKAQCLSTAAATGERWGTWGGVRFDDDVARQRVMAMWQHVNGTTESTTDTEETAA